MLHAAYLCVAIRVPMPDLHVCVLQALPGRACEEEAEEEEEERIYSKLTQ